jgi:ABC-2 type transport system permease protein
MFDRILAVAIKELRQLSRDRLSFGMIIGVPLMQMLLFGYAINFDVRGIPAAVVDEANTSHSRALVAELGAAGVVRFSRSDRRRGRAAPASERRRDQRGRDIPADFERRRLQNDRAAVQLLVDGSEPLIDSVAASLAMVPLPQRRGRIAPRRARSRSAPSTTPNGARRCRSCRR